MLAIRSWDGTELVFGLGPVRMVVFGVSNVGTALASKTVTFDLVVLSVGVDITRTKTKISVVVC